MSRLASILFYMLVALITCVMAGNVRTIKADKCTDEVMRQSAVNRLYAAGIFCILFIVSSLRFGIGNDYAQYTLTAHEAFVGGYVVTEPGFNMLVKVIYTLFNGEYYEIIFAAFAFVTLSIFLKTLYHDSADFAQSFFLFMMLGLYFQTFNTVRYYFALSIALCSMRYVLQKDYIRFVFFIFLAALFHKSILIVIPVYIMASFEWKKRMYVLGVIISAACFAGRGFILKLALVLYPSYKNTIYLDGGMSIVSTVRIFAVLLLYMWFMRCADKEACEPETVREIRFYGQLNFLAFLAATFFSFLPVVTRIVYYFSVSQLLMIPLLVKQLSDDSFKKKLKLIVFLTGLMYFLLFLLQAHQAGVGLLPYRMWLFEERYVFK